MNQQDFVVLWIETFLSNDKIQQTSTPNSIVAYEYINLITYNKHTSLTSSIVSSINPLWAATKSSSSYQQVT